MKSSIACPSCAHAEEIEAAAPVTIDDVGLFVCNACNTRVVHGKTLQRVVIEPFVDERGHKWVRRRFQDPKTKEDLHVVDIDPLLAAGEAKSLLSLVIP